MINKIFNCISIHNGGGITYLSLMHHELDKSNNLIFLDYRSKKKHTPFINAKTLYFKKNFFRNFFVFKERLKYTLLFRIYLNKNKKKGYIEEYFINGIPPFYRFPTSQNKVYIFLQNKNLFNYINYFDKKLFFKLNFILYHFLHSILINSFLKNTDTIIVQTKSMKKTISSLKPKNKIIVYKSFWKNITLKSYKEKVIKNNKKFTNKFLIQQIKDLSKNNKIYFYPSSFDPHKNHKRLFKAFNKLNHVSNEDIKLIVSIDEYKVPLQYRNNELIFFIGNQPIYVINQLYEIVDFLIFPSLNESLGLPLIEASFYNLPIIASDLDFVYEVCKPSKTFDPLSEEDIYRKILETID